MFTITASIRRSRRNMAEPSDIRPIGRDLVLLELATLLGRRRSITLTGPGGIGKTTIARVLTTAAADPERRTVFIDLAGVTRAGQLASRVAAALGLDEGPATDAAGAIDKALASARVLLVLDNLEEVDGAGPWVAARLAAAPEMQILGTSRVKLSYDGETVYPIAGLDQPNGPTGGDVEASAAGALFLERARSLVPEFDLDDVGWADLATLLARLDGLPLAIELAAARSRILGPGAMLRRIDSPGLLERAGEPPDRHRSLDGVLQWSLELLTPQQRELLEMLSSWTGEIELRVLERLAPRDGLLSDLDALVEAGLVVAALRMEPAFRVLETVRAALRRERPYESDAAVARWLTGALDAWAVSLGARTRSGEDVYASAAATVDELLERLATIDPATTQSLAVAAAPYRALAGAVRPALASVDRAVEAVDPGVRIRAILATSMLREILDGGGAGYAAADEALHLAAAAGEPALELAATHRAAESAANRTDPATQRLLRRALALASGEGSLRRADAIALRQRLADMGQDAMTSMRGLAELLPEAEAVGDPLLLASLLNDLAANETLVGRNESALLHARRAMALSAQAGSPLREAWTASIAAAAAARLHRVDEAASIITDAAEALDGGGASLRGFLLDGTLPLLGLLGAWRVAARLIGAQETHRRTTGQTNSPGEDVAWARDVASAQRLADPVAWHLEVEAGRSMTLAEVMAQVLESIRSRGSQPPSAPATLGLTKREVEVLALVGRGLSDGDIGRILYISPKTASVHVANIKAKLEVPTRLDAAMRARELGLVTQV